MRIFTAIFGIAAALLGCRVLLEELPFTRSAADRANLSLALAFMLVGIGLVVLALRGYRGGFVTVLGAVLLVFAIRYGTAAVNEHPVASKHAAFEYLVTLQIGVSAFILLLIGHRQHQRLLKFPNHESAMKLGTTVTLVCALSLLLGATGGLLYDRLFLLSRVLKSSIVIPIIEKAAFDRTAMDLIARGRADKLYDLAESGSLVCVFGGSMSGLSPEARQKIKACIDGLTYFYRAHRERVPHLQQEYPREAKLLGYPAP
jgi:hypothetical protein